MLLELDDTHRQAFMWINIFFFSLCLVPTTPQIAYEVVNQPSGVLLEMTSSVRHNS